MDLLRVGFFFPPGADVTWFIPAIDLRLGDLDDLVATCACSRVPKEAVRRVLRLGVRG